MSIDPSVRLRGRGIQFGSGVRIYSGTSVFGPVRFGDGVFLNRDVYIRSGTELGARVSIGPFCRLLTDSHEIGGPERRAGRSTSAPIRVGDGAWIGLGVTVLPGVTIGEGAVVAAGSVVTKDVPAHTLVGGVPARTLRELPREETVVDLTAEPDRAVRRS